ncbi:MULTISPECIES: hypothetical protein [Burkholderiaceae]|uniref:hypothetical protein n=1 Tax=Burkholderiaceae TaxID=119060 RepID=UPI001480865D|nr:MULTISPECIES: hypothetical protein [Burkholderiaceae]MCG1038522.1 hypothetical protein [Mycetohabitans sp. B7]
MRKGCARCPTRHLTHAPALKERGRTIQRKIDNKITEHLSKASLDAAKLVAQGAALLEPADKDNPSLQMPGAYRQR